MLAPDASGDTAVLSALVDMVNEVYAEAEDGLWVGGVDRTTVAEFAEFARAGQLAVALVGTRIVGCVHIQQIDGDRAEFGMLAAHHRHRGGGVGRELVRFAERNSCAQGHRAMQLRLLVPREGSHPAKKFLAAWYDRLGYRVVARCAFEEIAPERAHLLATPCDFLTYRKSLTTP